MDEEKHKEAAVEALAHAKEILSLDLIVEIIEYRANTRTQRSRRFWAGTLIALFGTSVSFTGIVWQIAPKEKGVAKVALEHFNAPDIDEINVSNYLNGSEDHSQQDLIDSQEFIENSFERKLALRGEGPWFTSLNPGQRISIELPSSLDETKYYQIDANNDNGDPILYLMVRFGTDLLTVKRDDDGGDSSLNSTLTWKLTPDLSKLPYYISVDDWESEDAEILVRIVESEGTQGEE